MESGRHSSNGADPTVWFHKVCLSTHNLDTSLLCLPMFVSGCHNLLVLAGPSYSTRVWCAVELFVFVQMGGTHERMIVRKFGGEQSERMLLQFEAVKAKCIDERDRHRLLAAIESSFGVLSAFDAVIHGILREQSVMLEAVGSSERGKRDRGTACNLRALALVRRRRATGLLRVTARGGLGVLGAGAGAGVCIGGGGCIVWFS